MNPLVSIIVPVYNAEEYLSECLESIINQTYCNLEIICVDDGSTDSSATIIREYREKDSRIKLIQQKNQFAGVARNYGFDESSGEYVMFLDADDFFVQTMIERMIEKIKEQKAEIVICGCEGIDNKTKQRRIFAVGNAINTEFLCGRDVIFPKDISEHIFQIKEGWAWDTMYSASFIRKKKIRFQSIRCANDALFTCLADAEADRIAIVNEILVIHRVNNPTALWMSRAPWWRCCYEMLDALQTELKNRNLYELYEKSYINWAADYITHEIYELARTVYFSEVYQFYQEKGRTQFCFADYDESYYYKKVSYQLIKKMNSLSSPEFLAEITDGLVSGIKEDGRTLSRICLPKDARIIVYGYGNLGRMYCQILREKGYQLQTIVDRNWASFQPHQDKVMPVEEITKTQFDYIVITVLDDNVAEEMYNYLIMLGIDESKILRFVG